MEQDLDIAHSPYAEDIMVLHARLIQSKMAQIGVAFIDGREAKEKQGFV